MYQLLTWWAPSLAWQIPFKWVTKLLQDIIYSLKERPVRYRPEMDYLLMINSVVFLLIAPVDSIVSVRCESS